MSTIFLVRHGETEWNREGRNQGRADSPLTSLGRRQAAAYGEGLRRLVDGRIQEISIVASPLGRAQSTAISIAEALGLAAAAISTHPELAELDCGAWEGLTAAEIAERFPEAFAQHRRDLWASRRHGGESRADVFRRARAWLESPRPTPITIAVAHGVVSRAVRGAYLGLAPEEILALPAHHHGRFFELAAGRVREVPVAIEAGESAE